MRSGGMTGAQARDGVLDERRFTDADVQDLLRVVLAAARPETSPTASRQDTLSYPGRNILISPLRNNISKGEANRIAAYETG